MLDKMPSKNASEVIEELARKLERQRIYNDLCNVETIEDIQELKEKYRMLCEEIDNWNDKIIYNS